MEEPYKSYCHGHYKEEKNALCKYFLSCYGQITAKLASLFDNSLTPEAYSFLSFFSKYVCCYFLGFSITLKSCQALAFNNPAN